MASENAETYVSRLRAVTSARIRSASALQPARTYTEASHRRAKNLLAFGKIVEPRHRSGQGRFASGQETRRRRGPCECEHELVMCQFDMSRGAVRVEGHRLLHTPQTQRHLIGSHLVQVEPALQI